MSLTSHRNLFRPLLKSSRVVASRNSPEVSTPTSQDKHDQCYEAALGDQSVLLAILSVEPLLSDVEDLATRNAQFACPLKVSQVDGLPGSKRQKEGNDHRDSSKNDVDNSHLVVRVVVVVLDDASNDADDNVHPAEEASY